MLTIESPSDLTGLHTWLKADAGVLKTIAGTVAAADTETIERWTDQSGNSRNADQSTAAKQPTLRASVQNSLPVVRFDGGDVLATSAFTALTQPFTVAFMAIANPDSTSRVVVGMTGSNVRVTSGNLWTALALTALSGAAATTSPVIVIAKFNGTSSLIRVNGTEATGDAGTGTASQLFVGGGTSTPTAPYNKDIGEVCIYSRGLTGAEISALETHLRSRWGI